MNAHDIPGRALFALVIAYAGTDCLNPQTGRNRITIINTGIILLLMFSSISCRESRICMMDQLLPAPREMKLKKSVLLQPESFTTIYLYSQAGENARFSAGLLRDAMNRIFHVSPGLEVVRSFEELSSPSIVLGIPSADPGFAGFCSGIPTPAEGNEEAYVLDIGKETIRVSGGGEAGLFYGIQTLIQLLEEAGWQDGVIPGMVISDWPELRERWVHFNYFFHLDRFEYIQEAIRKLAGYKVNGIVFEFEDQFGYRKYPTIAAPTAFSPQQVKELSRFARQYHIDLIPLVQGFGHAAYILKHDEFKHLREDPKIFQSFCPLREETYDLIFDLFSETIEATPGVEYFHIGGDEVRVMGECPLCQEKKKEIGELGLYLSWLNRVNKFMQEHDRSIVFWDDMPLKKAGVYQTTRVDLPGEVFDSVWSIGGARLDSVVDLFPRENVFMRWNYGPARSRGNIRTLDWYRDNGFDRMIATAVIGNHPLIQDYGHYPENIRSFITLGAGKEVLGVLCTAWGDDAGNHFEIYWMGFLATAEFAWSSDHPHSVDRYWGKYIRRFFGPGTVGLDSAFHSLSRRVQFWNTALLKQGTKHRNHHAFPENLIALPDLQALPEEGSWTAHFQPLMDRASEEKIRCRQATETIEQNLGRVVRNAYNLEVFASMGRLMEAHCDLVMAIGHLAAACDLAKAALAEGQKEEAVKNLNEMATVAGSAWNTYRAVYLDLEKIWEIARYPKGGEGYVLNTQTNYLAGRTADLSYLILAEEKLDLPGYAESMKAMAGRYKN
jgi:hypothetical protein